MQADRSRVIAVIKDLSEGLRAEKAHPQAGARHDETAVLGLLRLACERVGVALEDYKATIDADATLAKLENDAMVQALAGSTDPGPHDAISREAPSGQPNAVRRSVS